MKFKMTNRQLQEQNYLLLCKQSNTTPLKDINKISDIGLMIEINTILKTNNCIPFTPQEIEDILDK
jgi:hypothetical protein